MSLDLFSSMDFFFTNFSFLSVFSIFLSVSLFFLFFFQSKKFSRISSAMKKCKKLLKQNLSFVLNFKISNILLLISIFYFILLSNLLGLFPFAFGWTSHILIMLQLSLFFWLMMNLSSMCYKLMKYFSHYTPQGVPLLLGLFLAKIELMSNLIRPLTLSLRLGMNITTGHILLALISVMGVNSSLKFIILAFLVFYFFFEIFVMFIQAVVYTLLMSQYFEG